MKTIILILLILPFFVSAKGLKYAEKLIKSERYEEALIILDSIKEAQKFNSYIDFLQGETILKAYQADSSFMTKKDAVTKATIYFNNGKSIDPTGSINYIGRGMVELFANSDTVNADFYFSEAMKYMPARNGDISKIKKRKLSAVQKTALLKLASAELYSAAPRFNKSLEYLSVLEKIMPQNANVYFQKGNIYLAMYDASSAILAFKTSLALKKTPSAAVKIGEIYYMAKNWDEAINYFNLAKEIDSKFAPVYKALGAAYYKKGNHAEAAKQYALFLKLSDNNIPAKVSYTNALYRSNSFELAIEQIKNILAVDSSRGYLYRLAAYSYMNKKTPSADSALQYMAQYFSVTPKDKVIQKDYEYASKMYFAVGTDSLNMRKGIEMLEKLYRTDTLNTAPIIEIISRAHQAQFFDTEILYLEKLKKIKKSSNIEMQLGKAFSEKKDYTSAEVAFKNAYSLDTNNIDALIWQANSLSALDPDKKDFLAKPVIEKILTRLSNDSAGQYSNVRFDAYMYLCSYYMSNKTLNYNKVIENASACLLLAQQNKNLRKKALSVLAYAYFNVKQWKKSRDLYVELLALDPNDKIAAKVIIDINKYLVVLKRK